MTRRRHESDAETVADADASDHVETGLFEGRQLPPPPAAPARRVTNSLTAISMKTPDEVGEVPSVSPPVLPPAPVVKIRAISEVGNQTPPRGFGRLAPPHDPSVARARRRREIVTLVSLVVIVAAIVSALIGGLSMMAR